MISNFVDDCAEYLRTKSGGKFNNETNFEIYFEKNAEKYSQGVIDWAAE